MSAKTEKTHASHMRYNTKVMTTNGIFFAAANPTVGAIKYVEIIQIKVLCQQMYYWIIPINIT